MKRGAKKTSRQEKKMTGRKPVGGGTVAPHPEVKSMMGKKPFDLQPKKPEPDDRPRPARPPSTNKNTTKTKSARVKRLTGLML